MNKTRDSTPMKGRPAQSLKICIHYGNNLKQNGAKLQLTEIFPDEQLSIDWYGA